MSKLRWLSNTWNLLLHSQINNELQIRKREVEAMERGSSYKRWKKMQNVQETSKEAKCPSSHSSYSKGNSFWLAEWHYPLCLLPPLQQDISSPKSFKLHKMAGDLWAILIQLSWREIERAEDLWMTEESIMLIIGSSIGLIWAGWKLFKMGIPKWYLM